MLTLLVAGLSVIVVILFVLIRRNTVKHALLQMEYEKLQQQSTLFKQHMMKVEERLNELSSGSLGMGDRLEQVTQNVQSLVERQEQFDNSEPESRLYSKANKMAAKGATVEELMHDCELPRAEAELLVSLHNRD